MASEDKIKESLLDQLKAQNKVTDYCVDMVETYMAHWRLKEQLIEDIQKNGLRISVTSGNGFDTDKPNSSIGDLQKETSTMLQILDKLDIRTPVLSGKAHDYL